MKSFYLIYSERVILQTPSAKSSRRVNFANSVCKIKINGEDRTVPRFTLSWSHYLFLMRMEEAQRRFYEIEAQAGRWSFRELERQFNSSLYERLALSRSKKKVLELSRKGQLIERPEDAVEAPRAGAVEAMTAPS